MKNARETLINTGIAAIQRDAIYPEQIKFYGMDGKCFFIVREHALYDGQGNHFDTSTLDQEVERN